MWNNKIATAIFWTSQCQDGDEVLKFYEMDVRALKDVLENLNTRKSPSGRILGNEYFVEKFWTTQAKFKL